MALGTKANALFLPPIAILYVLLRGRRRAYLLPWLAIMAAVFFLSWPYLWSHPIDALMRNARYLLLRRTDIDTGDAAGPFAMIAFTTPPLFLLAFVVGLVPLVRKVRNRDSFSLLLTCWMVVVGGRLLLPASVNFDGVRHFLEIFPPMAIIAALGVAALGRWRRLASAAVIASVTIALALVHPFESAYWNVLIGGLEGAMTRQIPQAGDYWAASYRIGLRAINRFATRRSDRRAHGADGGAVSPASGHPPGAPDQSLEPAHRHEHARRPSPSQRATAGLRDVHLPA